MKININVSAGSVKPPVLKRIAGILIGITILIAVLAGGRYPGSSIKNKIIKFPSKFNAVIKNLDKKIADFTNIETEVDN